MDNTDLLVKRDMQTPDNSVAILVVSCSLYDSLSGWWWWMSHLCGLPATGPEFAGWPRVLPVFYIRTGGLSASLLALRLNGNVVSGL